MPAWQWLVLKMIGWALVLGGIAGLLTVWISRVRAREDQWKKIRRDMGRRS